VATATTQHHKAERKKFTVNGSHTSIHVLEDLVQQHILLLPFTVDHLGGLAPLAYHLFFGPDRHKAPDPAPWLASPIFERNRQIATLHNGLWTQLLY
jgi:hypothetical protein